MPVRSSRKYNKGKRTMTGLLISRPDLADSVLRSKVAKGLGHNSYGEPAFPNDLLYTFPICILCTIVVCLGLGIVDQTSSGDEADPFVTPDSILPEWYLYPSYTLLRRIPDKLLGLFSIASVPIATGLIPFIENGNGFQNPLRRPLGFTVFGFGLVAALGLALSV
jgi:cytochrome b6-f complex subunit 4